MSEPSFGGARYLLMFRNDCYRKTFGYLLKEKYDTFQSFVDFKRIVENQTGITIKRIIVQITAWSFLTQSLILFSSHLALFMRLPYSSVLFSTTWSC